MAAAAVPVDPSAPRIDDIGKGKLGGNEHRAPVRSEQRILNRLARALSNSQPCPSRITAASMRAVAESLIRRRQVLAGTAGTRMGACAIKPEAPLLALSKGLRSNARH